LSSPLKIDYTKKRKTRDIFINGSTSAADILVVMARLRQTKGGCLSHQLPRGDSGRGKEIVRWREKEETIEKMKYHPIGSE
ncbi:hypothetical protein AVEN_223922-1, partial [Araneus ventricosus]